jgi:Domain of unknown function (DUF4352)
LPKVRRWVAPVGAAVLSLGVVSAAAGCGFQPSASDLWGRPLQSVARNAHATIIAAGSGNREALRGEGTVVFKPRMAMSLQLLTRLGPFPGELDVLEVGGVTYQRAGAGQKWQHSSAPAPDPTWEGATNPHLLGEDLVNGDRAWHLAATRAGLPVEMWVRMSDGFPLQVLTSSDTGAVLRFVYDRFNAAGDVAAPRAPDIEQPARTLTGQVGDSLSLSAARITVISCDDNAAPDDDSIAPRPGNRFIVIEVVVQNTSGDDLSTFFDWQLTDSARDTWSQSLSVREPSFPGGELAPGESARGYLTYEVSSSASQLVMAVKVDDDTAVFTLD